MVDTIEKRSQTFLVVLRLVGGLLRLFLCLFHAVIFLALGYANNETLSTCASHDKFRTCL
jgi:hypothetical protein